MYTWHVSTDVYVGQNSPVNDYVFAINVAVILSESSRIASVNDDDDSVRVMYSIRQCSSVDAAEMQSRDAVFCCL